MTNEIRGYFLGILKTHLTDVDITNLLQLKIYRMETPGIDDREYSIRPADIFIFRQPQSLTCYPIAWFSLQPFRLRKPAFETRDCWMNGSDQTSQAQPAYRVQS
jgi:hypothetical protein